ncbi:hypothetical protein CMI42_06385 [Candidatus Pacearchaeota archaeon]|nr:hypothetical protein [Candidatus Pacearchaeota archaeon]
MEGEAITKKIGGSIGIIIPKHIVESKRIIPNQKVKFELEKVSPLKSIWGKHKNIEMDVKKILDEIDEGEIE